jgi:hypothetical protein
LNRQQHFITPIKFNFNLTNLPTGQLAEATIAGYDNNGRPNTATDAGKDPLTYRWYINDATTPIEGISSDYTGWDVGFRFGSTQPTHLKSPPRSEKCLWSARRPLGLGVSPGGAPFQERGAR